MIIPGQLIALVTFPGVIVHEMAHQFFCRLAGVAVFHVCYFRFGNPAGYVKHEVPQRLWQHVLICVAPFFVNTLLGALIALPAAIPVMTFDAGSTLNYVLIWLGVSIAMHAFPSTGDGAAMWVSIKQPGVSWLARLLVAPLVGFIFLFSIGSMFWLDAIYGGLVVMALPYLLIRALA